MNPGPADTDQSIGSILVKPTVIAGTPIEYIILPRDEYGNYLNLTT